MTTDKINDGGPAFPERYQAGSHVQGDGRCQFTVPTLVDRPGMSLRDWFAGQALVAAFPAIMGMAPSDLPGLATKLGLDGSVTPYDLVATASLKTAAAMLKAREAQP